MVIIQLPLGITLSPIWRCVSTLTHCGLVTPYDNTHLGQHWFNMNWYTTRLLHCDTYISNSNVVRLHFHSKTHKSSNIRSANNSVKLAAVLNLDWLFLEKVVRPIHYGDVIMGAIAPQITSLTIVYSTVYSDADQRKHQSSASPAFVRGIHRDRWIPRTNGQ